MLLSVLRAKHAAVSSLFLLAVAGQSLGQDAGRDDILQQPRYGLDATVREHGRCSMYDTCGSKGGVFGQKLPCADNSKAREIDDDLRETLDSVCGKNTVDWKQACCTLEQLTTLQSSLAQAEPLIALCPACRLNFRDFYCALTCSPDQSLFVTVTSIQNLSSNSIPSPDEIDLHIPLDASGSANITESDGPAVKSLAYHVDPSFGSGFFDSCKSVKFGATNGYAMDLIGGGAKTWLAFLKYMGTERPGLGSPFSIDFPQPPSFQSLSLVKENIHLSADEAQLPAVGDEVSRLQPYNATALRCDSDDSDIRCACADCPKTCLALPAIRSPAEERAGSCRVGKISCFSFVLLLLYALGLLAFIFGIGIQSIWEMRGNIRLPSGSRGLKTSRSDLLSNNGNGDDRLPMEDNDRFVYNNHGKANSWRGSDSATSGPESAGMETPSNSGSLSRRHLGRGASLLHPDADGLASYQPRTYALNNLLSRFFYRLGLICAGNPFLTIALGLAVCGLLNSGWSKFAVEKDPVKLWVAKGSATEVNKEKFDAYFGPFYRTQQIFVSVAPPPGSEGDLFIDEPVLSWERLNFWASIEEGIRQLRSPQHNYTLKDVCFAPRSDSEQGATEDDCIVQSFLGYFGNSIDTLSPDTWEDQIDDCATTPSACLPPSGLPLNPRLLFGRIPGFSGTSPSDSEDVQVKASQARALVITYVVTNSLDEQVVRRAEEWEETLRLYLDRLQVFARQTHNLQISYSTGVSLEQELNKSTNTDVPIVIMSYLVMFLYVSLSLGGTTSALMRFIGNLFHRLWSVITNRQQNYGPIALTDGENQPSLKFLFHRILTESKFLLGLWGIIIVLLSVSTSVGVFSMFGVKITLIIAEVIPFLVLAIGVDNVFLLAHEVQRQNTSAYATIARLSIPQNHASNDLVEALPPAEERVAKALSRMGPSILLSATCESVAFALGALVGMPAVRNFAIYAAGAVAINAILQVTVFVSAIALDIRRTESTRVDCVPCIKLPSIPVDSYSFRPSFNQNFIAKVYAPFLLHRRVKQAVVVAFSCLFVLSWAGAREVQLGLDQRLALPPKSYLVAYFDALDAFLDVGPPVYFVAENVDVEHRDGQEALCSRFSTCDTFSLSATLEAERKRPEASFLAEPPAVWIDDFFQWLNPVLDSCCRVKTRNHSEFCGPNDSDFACMPCYEAEPVGWHVNLDGLPEGRNFSRYLQHWLESPTDEACPLGGKASYGSALMLDQESEGVKASHFRTFHTPLKSQADFIDSLAAADRIAASLSQRLDTTVFPYSLHYVFFDQYGYITATTREVLLLAWLAVLMVSSISLGSWRTGTVITITVAMTSLNVMGVMGVWNISLNAISLVNLVISVGIAVEFCSHIARAFMSALSGGLPHHHPGGSAERDERAWTALADVGSSVFTGITMTKLIGIVVLALTHSKLLRTYYFKMWLVLIISGALHGLVFLPVALSYQGGQGYASGDDHDEDYIAQHLTSNYSSGQRPFLVHDDDRSDESDG